MAQSKPGKTDLHQQGVTANGPGRDNTHRLTLDESEIAQAGCDQIGRRMLIDMAHPRMRAQRQVGKPRWSGMD